MTSVSAAATATTPPRPLRPQRAFARLPDFDEPQSALFLPSVGLAVLTHTPLLRAKGGSAVLDRTLVRGPRASLTHTGQRPKDHSLGGERSSSGAGSGGARTARHRQLRRALPPPRPPPRPRRRPPPARPPAPPK